MEIRTNNSGNPTGKKKVKPCTHTHTLLGSKAELGTSNRTEAERNAPKRTMQQEAAN